MIVLYGGEDGEETFAGIVEIDTATVTVEEDGEEVEVSEPGQAPNNTFTETPSSTIQQSKMSFYIDTDADNLEIDSATAVVRQMGLSVPNQGSPLPKEELINDVYIGMDVTFQNTDGYLSAIKGDQVVTANVQKSDVERNVDDKLTITREGERWKLVFENDPTLLSSSGNDIAFVHKLKIIFSVTKGSVTVQSDEATIAYSDLLYRPRVANSTNKLLYVVDGKFKMAGGWCADTTIPFSAYAVFKTTTGPIAGFFYNKFYEIYDPIAFGGSLMAFAYTSTRVGDLFTCGNVIAKREPYFPSLNGSATAYAVGGGGSVGYSVEDGEMVMDVSGIESDNGQAIVQFNLPDSVYGNVFLHIPTNNSPQIPIAIAIDGKIAYDRFAVVPTLGQLPHTHLETKTFGTFMMGYLHAMAMEVVNIFLNFLPFAIYTRGISLLYSPATVPSVFQILMLNLHTGLMMALGGSIMGQFGRHLRGMGFMLTNSLRGLSKEQQRAVVDEMFKSIEDEFHRGKSKQGMMMLYMFAPLPMPFSYSDGISVKDGGLGATLDTDLIDLHSNSNSLADDDFKAATRRHTMFSVDESVITLNGRSNYSYAGFNGNMVRVIKNGNINDIGGIPDSAYQAGKKWEAPISGDLATLDGVLSDMMMKSKSGRWARFGFGPNDDDGISASRLREEPSPGGGHNQMVNHSICKISHINLDTGTVKIWGRANGEHYEGQEMSVTILKPNKNIILAIKDD